MIKDGTTISTIEIATITGKKNDEVMMDAKCMLLGLHGDMDVSRFNFAQPDWFLLSYRHALLLAGQYKPALAAKIIDALEEK